MGLHPPPERAECGESDAFRSTYPKLGVDEAFLPDIGQEVAD